VTSVEPSDQLLEQVGATEVIERARTAYFEDALSRVADAGLAAAVTSDSRQESLATALEHLALSEASRDEQRRLAEHAFTCRRAVPDNFPSPPERVAHYFFLCVDGLLAERHSELAMLLRQADLDVLLRPDRLDSGEYSWEEQVLHRTSAAFILLCRKAGGWDDIRSAAEHVQRLRILQEAREAPYLEGVSNPEPAVGWILALYNVAKVVDVVATFLIEGTPADPLIHVQRFIGQAERLLVLFPNLELSSRISALAVGADLLCRSSVWYGTRQLGQRFREFINEIAGAHRESPVLELWPSQRSALTNNLLNPARRAIVVEMPTSAGKTLIAEFAIVQALALDPGATVAYVVPTRALVNQVTTRLRRDFHPLGYTVEAAVPVFELDPTEDRLLRQGVNIVVLTPEKLDLLLRTGHPAVEQLSLVVADEAHNLAEGQRGARLELMLGMIRRERDSARFLLLTPFLPNGADLALWLGDDPDSRIEVRWKPSDRVAAAATLRKVRRGPRLLELTTLASASNVDVGEGISLPVAEVSPELRKSKGSVATAAAIALSRRGGVLLLESGRSYAENRAIEVGEAMPEVARIDDAVLAVANFARTELGENHPLPGLLAKGVAYHHAGLSHELRQLIEWLIDAGHVRVVAGTTTLAQGVNFPIASVIVSSVSKYVGPPKGNQPLSYAEFWNIAGRAGRAMKDRVGLVVFPAAGPKDVVAAQQYLRAEAEHVSSALIGALASLSDLTEAFNLSFVARHPSVSVFLQYLVHAMRLAGHERATAELEDILRSSLVYSQARQTDRAVAEKLVALSRRYMDEVRGKEPGYLALADGTGFSLSTVDMLYAVQRSEHGEFEASDFWSPSNLFSGDLTSLTDVVSVLGRIPELDLGRFNTGDFSPEQVAGIVRDWVRGVPVGQIAEAWFSHIVGVTERVRTASVYVYSKLVGQVPWGIGAIQRLALSGDRDDPAGHVPAMVFYGVASQEAVQLRMAGVPRVAAEGMARQLRDQSVVVETFAGVRDWVSGLDERAWSAALPTESAMTGEQCRRAWATLSGVG
jgi:helicase